MRSLGEMIEIGVNPSIVFISYFSCRDVSTFSRYLTRGVSAWQKRRPEQHSSIVCFCLGFLAFRIVAVPWLHFRTVGKHAVLCAATVAGNDAFLDG